uniref:Uncharacterized protein n=1 Tax=Vespula pensylvanica TaxID=30213 RepID=A0A834PI82_VESPE|nr:hypothetical protein H0235_001692 [Vespula pensylvanica]
MDHRERIFATCWKSCKQSSVPSSVGTTASSTTCLVSGELSEACSDKRFLWDLSSTSSPWFEELTVGASTRRYVARYTRRDPSDTSSKVPR